MARFMFVVPPLFGHVAPTVAVGQELLRRGHEVVWFGVLAPLREALLAGLPVMSIDSADAAVFHQGMRSRFAGLNGLANLKFFFAEYLTPLTAFMLPRLQEAIDHFHPDVLAVDHVAYAGAIAARQRKLPWATLATTSVSTLSPNRSWPKWDQWIQPLLRNLLQLCESEVGAQPELSPHLVVVFSTEALTGPQPNLSAVCHLVGPSLRKESTGIEFPWDRLREGRCVLVSIGTVNSDEGSRFFRVATKALADLPLQVVLVAKPEMLGGEIPASFIVQPFVPQLSVLGQVDAVVCHGGHNTTVEALSFGLPLVIAPINTDQPVVASQVVSAGAGLRVRYRHLQPAELRAAVTQVLIDPRYRQAARVIQASFGAAGGAPRAAQLLEGISRGHRLSSQDEAHPPQLTNAT